MKSASPERSGSFSRLRPSPPKYESGPLYFVGSRACKGSFSEKNISAEEGSSAIDALLGRFSRAEGSFAGDASRDRFSTDARSASGPSPAEVWRTATSEEGCRTSTPAASDFPLLHFRTAFSRSPRTRRDGLFNKRSGEETCVDRVPIRDQLRFPNGPVRFLHGEVRIGNPYNRDAFREYSAKSGVTSLSGRVAGHSFGGPGDSGGPEDPGPVWTTTTSTSAESITSK